MANSSTSDRYKKIGVDIFSGTIAGINVTFVGHPFETLKVRLQTQPQGANKIYSGLFDCVKKTWEWEGIRGFYRGVSSPLAGQIFFRSVFFLSNAEYVRFMSNNYTRQLKLYEYALGGTFSWTLCAFIEGPLQLASSQMQVQIIKEKSNPNYKSPYRSVLDFLRKTTAENGIAGIYQGIAPTILRNFVGGAFHIGVFEAIRRKYAEHRGIPVEKAGFWISMFAGSMGGLSYWTITYPIDVVKSSIQSDSISPTQRQYKGVIDAFQQLYKEGGFKRFTRGFSACAARALPANAVLLTTATMIKDVGYGYLKDQKSKKSKL